MPGPKVDASESRAQPPGTLRVLGFTLLGLSALSIIGQVGDDPTLGGLALAVVIGVGGGALAKTYRWGYILVGLQGFGLIASAAYLLLVASDRYSWSAPVGFWMFLVPGSLIIIILMLPSSRRWFQNR